MLCWSTHACDMIVLSKARPGLSGTLKHTDLGPITHVKFNVTFMQNLQL